MLGDRRQPFLRARQIAPGTDESCRWGPSSTGTIQWLKWRACRTDGKLIAKGKEPLGRGRGPALAVGHRINLMTPVTPMCEVHLRPTEPREVRIAYGLRRNASVKYSPAYRTAKRMWFPHCDDVFKGGCMIRAEKTRLKQVCRACCEARDAWLRERHPDWAESHKLDGL